MTEDALKLLDNVSDHIDMAAANGITNLQDPLLALLITLSIISIATEFEMFFNHCWNWGNLFTKFIHIGFLAFLIENWGMFLVMIKESGQQIGLVAGGSEAFFTPTQLLSKSCNDIYNSFGTLMKSFPGFMSTGSIIAYVLAMLALCVALYALFRIAFTLFMANAEFLILGALSMVLLPFGITRWTSSICEKTWGILLTCAVKLMVAVFMVCLIGNEITTAFNVSDNVTNETVAGFITSACSLLFLSYLSAQAVDMAGAMTAGGVVATNNIIHAVPQAYRDVRGGVGTAVGAIKAPIRLGRGTVQGGKAVARGARKTYGVAKSGVEAAGRMAQKVLGWWQK